MKDKERTGVIILFHEVLSFVNFAQLEFFKEGVLKEFVFDEAGEGEVGFEGFEDEGFVSGGFFLFEKREVFVDLAVIALHFDGTELTGFSFAFFKHEFSFASFKPEIPERAEGSIGVSSVLVHEEYFL